MLEITERLRPPATGPELATQIEDAPSEAMATGDEGTVKGLCERSAPLPLRTKRTLSLAWSAAKT